MPYVRNLPYNLVRKMRAKLDGKQVARTAARKCGPGATSIEASNLGAESQAELESLCAQHPSVLESMVEKLRQERQMISSGTPAHVPTVVTEAIVRPWPCLIPLLQQIACLLLNLPTMLKGVSHALGTLPANVGAFQEKPRRFVNDATVESTSRMS